MKFEKNSLKNHWVYQKTQNFIFSNPLQKSSYKKIVNINSIELCGISPLLCAKILGLLPFSENSFEPFATDLNTSNSTF